MPTLQIVMSTQSDEKQVFAVGERFRLSEFGSRRCPLLAHKVGNIVAPRENSASVIVRFDGNKTTTTIHRDYIEPIA